jgi:hypothetical protein
MRPQHLDHFVAHDLDNLLRWRKRGQDFLPHRFFTYGFNELLGDAEMHVRLKQRDADLPQRGFHIFRRKFTFSTESLENPLEFIA